MPICDICHARPASGHVTVMQNGQRKTIAICDYDYRQLMRHQNILNPFDSLLGGGGPFSRFFDDISADPLDEPGGFSAEVPRESVDATDAFSKQTLELLQRAAEKAHELRRSELDTEHLLYVLADTDVCSALLAELKLSPQDIKSYIDQHAYTGDAEVPLDKMTVSPRLKKAFMYAFQASRDLGHSYVGPEHLLIGLSEVTDSVAGALLKKYGVTPEALRQKVVKLVGKGAEDGRIDTPTSTPTLDKFGRDLTEMARQGKLDPVLGRAQEIESTIEVLARRKKNNPVLIGEPGVGKTAIVEGLAQRIVKGDVPEVLRGKRLVEVNINSMVAGAKYRGEFEERAKQLIDEVSEKNAELILFIDELHTIVGAGQGGGEGGLDIANVLKPALARGELSLIGATTLNEYQKHIEKDAALERRFQPVLVPEPTVDQTIVILRGLRDKLEAHHQVTFVDAAFVAAAELSDRYITSRFLPDKAIDLIDQAAARVRIGATSRPAEMQELEAEIAHLKREQDYSTSRKRFDEVKTLEERIGEKQAQLSEQTEAWQRKTGSETLEVTVASVAEVVSRLTGIPVADLTQEERKKLLNMEDKLRERVVGQDDAVEAVSDAVRLSRAGLGQPHRPIATFLFLGPTGVGKTELAKAIAETVFGDEQAIIRIDMSEYMERHAVARLIGAPPGYVGYDEGGQLTERVRRRPYSVILLDEIEKAHPDVYNVLLQVFDDGRLTDGKGRVVDFSNTTIIATSNLGSAVIMANAAQPETERKSDKEIRDELMQVLKGHFRPEFLNRIDEIIVFNALSQQNIRLIVQIQLDLLTRTAAAQDIRLKIADSLVEHLVDVGYQPDFGARELKRKIRQQVETRLAKEILGDRLQSGDSVEIGYDAENEKVVFNKITPSNEENAKPAAADEEKPSQTAPAAPNEPQA
ncbi:ATP-dependent Clp protease ATP-binding subunit [Serratia ficaria]|uniref:ATP-dependent Clp protease ATP-binding subunit n=1 Tax=Serratia ficaria TaxID=61651 RepID=UPI00077C8C44|nr:AAA family ATPase [Serratia ficaria]CAI1004489.1 Negative regulator of genetic competence ClpC/MecB [Serratia ficaria]CAI1683499.1 Negative regulator of genetic competence ClpC/MecB [Serratia ficaria]CAI2421168.1 Negative regulator of genetic competence ClpC/MecB [Serratia ficaria]CAI2495825.1 Negative regulator of genetic competence ClpC/MecB [Serratia ficaria]CAI2499224.1 Negative regulator of genetic competence ClpC/MecB [Serratia ficaria]